jgi:NADP-dependent 3-hydroxy acid dehydrogenase YdfG
VTDRHHLGAGPDQGPGLTGRKTAVPTEIDPEHVLVIGAGPGLGSAVARRFAREGLTVTVVGRRREALDDLAVQLCAAGGTADTFVADPGVALAFKAAMQQLARRISPGIVVYNAAIVAADNVLEADLGYLVTAYDVDAFGAISAAQVFTPAMRAAGAGTYIVSGGYAWVDPYPGYATIALGKAGVRTAVALMHPELKADGVHAVSTRITGPIAPGTALDPDAIADTYWELHNRPPGEWTDEVVIAGG